MLSGVKFQCGPGCNKQKAKLKLEFKQKDLCINYMGTLPPATEQAACRDRRTRSELKKRKPVLPVGLAYVSRHIPHTSNNQFKLELFQ